MASSDRRFVDHRYHEALAAAEEREKRRRASSCSSSSSSSSEPNLSDESTDSSSDECSGKKNPSRPLAFTSSKTTFSFTYSSVDALMVSAPKTPVASKGPYVRKNAKKATPAVATTSGTSSSSSSTESSISSTSDTPKPKRKYVKNTEAEELAATMDTLKPKRKHVRKTPRTPKPPGATCVPAPKDRIDFRPPSPGRSFLSELRSKAEITMALIKAKRDVAALEHLLANTRR